MRKRRNCLLNPFRKNQSSNQTNPMEGDESQSNTIFQSYHRPPDFHPPTVIQHPHYYSTQFQPTIQHYHQMNPSVSTNFIGFQPPTWPNSSNLSCYRCGVRIQPNLPNFYTCSSCPKTFCFTCVNKYYNSINFQCESCMIHRTLQVTQL